MTTKATVLQPRHWDAQYRARRPVWDTGRPCSELKRVLAEYSIRPCRAVELGCGTGTNAIWLALKGFQVTGIDLSERAIVQARRRAVSSHAYVHLVAGDLLEPWLLKGPYDFFLDCGCYHAARLGDAEGYLRTVERITRPGSLGLVLMGNDDEPEDKEGPPTLDQQTILDEWTPRFEVVHLRPFRFDPPTRGGRRYLGWSCLVKRRG